MLNHSTSIIVLMNWAYGQFWQIRWAIFQIEGLQSQNHCLFVVGASYNLSPGFSRIFVWKTAVGAASVPTRAERGTYEHCSYTVWFVLTRYEPFAYCVFGTWPRFLLAEQTGNRPADRFEPYMIIPLQNKMKHTKKSHVDLLNSISYSQNKPVTDRQRLEVPSAPARSWARRSSTMLEHTIIQYAPLLSTIIYTTVLHNTILYITIGPDRGSLWHR